MQHQKHASLSSVISNVVSLQKHIADMTAVLELFNDKVGVLECLTIIKSNLKVPELDHAVADLTAKLESYQLTDMPLIQVKTTADEKYDIKLARTDKLITGEYIKLEELLYKMDYEESQTLKKNLEIMQNRLIMNSIKVYNSLKTAAKNTGYGRKFDGLMISKKTKYLYYYPVDKKKTLSFVAHLVTDLNE